MTAHAFWKTTATILEGAGQTPRQVATNSGTSDFHHRRRLLRPPSPNPEAAKHLEEALRHVHDRDRTDVQGPELAPAQNLE
ncbi:hypothetical protein AB0E69_33915 [Kribbella sp. NPDC026611]|uniref:hypothetical protein n=1 Tax=Kribbella sp. NPDC026611 TaxID=3154911 RepID=UPI003409E58B